MTNLDTCQDFYATSEGAATSTAVDTRYENSCLDEPLPNEWEVQSYSSVELTLTGMPFYSTYLPRTEAFAVKSKVYYDLWARTTLDYKVDCDKSINDAYGVLKLMSEAETETSNFNRACWIVAASFAGA